MKTVTISIDGKRKRVKLNSGIVYTVVEVPRYSYLQSRIPVGSKVELRTNEGRRGRVLRVEVKRGVIFDIELYDLSRLKFIRGSYSISKALKSKGIILGMK